MLRLEPARAVAGQRAAPADAPIAAEPAFEPFDPAGRAGPARVDVASLTDLDAAVGLERAETLGLPVDGWRGAASAEAERLIGRLSPGGLPTADALAISALTLILEPPRAPVGGAGSEPGALLSARLDALLRYGAASQAAALAAAAGPARAASGAGLAAALTSGADETACAAVLGQTGAEGLEAIYCRAASGDALGAELALQATRALDPDADPLTLAWLDAVADPGLAGLAETPAETNALSPIILAAMRRLERSLQADFARDAAMAQLEAALVGAAAPRTRLEALERLAASGAQPIGRLERAYSAAASAESGGVWGRVEATRAAISALSGGAAEAAAAAAEAALVRGRQAGRPALTAALLAPSIAARTERSGAPEGGLSTSSVREILRLGGEAALARRLAGAPGGAPPGPEERAVDALAGPTGDDVAAAKPLLARAVRGDQSAGRVLAGLAALNAPSLADDVFAPLDGLLFAAQDRGEATLLFEALAALSAGPAITPDALHEALGKLKVVGLEAQARRIALEAAILGG